MSYTRTLKETYLVPFGASSSTVANMPKNVSITFTGTRSGSKVDGWKGKIEKGLTASSPYSLDMTKIVVGGQELHRIDYQMKASPYAKYFSSAQGHPANQWLGQISHLPVSTSKARSMALSKLYKKLESDRSEMNAYASLAEITDVLRQFGRPFASIVDAFVRHENRLYFEKRRLVGSKTWKDEKFAQIAASTWLETSFGLIPLISDAESLAKALARWQYELSDNPKLRDRMRTRALDNAATLVVKNLNPDVTGGHKFVTTIRTETEARAQYVVGLSGDVRADFGSNARLLELLGLEGRNIPLAVWEATPWSWLVDYGTNVQQILQAGAVVTSRVQWIVLTETSRTVQHLITNATPYYDTVNYRLLSAQSDVPPRAEDRGIRVIRTTLNRTIPVALGVPPLYLKSPLGDLKKVANLLAVAVTRSKDRTTWLS